MKCIYCGNDSKYQDRTAGSCPGCKRQFAFEPKTGDKLTDMAFKNAINAVSADGRIRWGVEHLYYEVNRRILKKGIPTGCLMFGIPFLATFLYIALFVKSPGILPFALIAGIILVVLIISAFKRLRRTVPVDKSTFNSMWDRWVNAHGKPKAVIERAPQPAPPTDLEEDIGEYSFDRAVICDRARTADLLLANNFHFENNCAVLSITGYPQGPFETVRKMLKRNPKLIVIALHDASPEGCKLAHKLRTDPAWFADGVKVFDMGLRPRNAKPYRGLYLSADGPMVDAVDGVTASEAIWLTGYTLELAAIRPERILKGLFAALNRQTVNNDEGTTDGVIVDGSSGGGGGDDERRDDIGFDGYDGGDGGEGGVDGFG